MALDLGVGRVVAQRPQEQRASSAWPPRLLTARKLSQGRSLDTGANLVDIPSDTVGAGLSGMSTSHRLSTAAVREIPDLRSWYFAGQPA